MYSQPLTNILRSAPIPTPREHHSWLVISWIWYCYCLLFCYAHIRWIHFCFWLVVAEFHAHLYWPFNKMTQKMGCNWCATSSSPDVHMGETILIHSHNHSLIRLLRPLFSSWTPFSMLLFVCLGGRWTHTDSSEVPRSKLLKAGTCMYKRIWVNFSFRKKNHGHL